MFDTKCSLFLIIAGISFSVAQNKSKVVNITQGPVRGYRSPHDIYEFKGIPYATAPTGSDKFKAPLPGPTWTEVFVANLTNIICPQFVSNSFVEEMHMREDCLIANIYTPDTDEIKLPVVVIVHGGGYQTGWGDKSSPQAMVEQGNFIAITFNYRLGIHGFLCLGTEDIPGNAGMKDQVAALRWVKNNIASFGGDPDDITLSGCSAASSAVELLMLSETTRGVFNKVVPQSGVAIALWSVQLDPTQFAKEFAQTYLHFETDDIQTLENFYKTKSIDELIFTDFAEVKDSSIGFVPCIERDGSENTEAFLKEAPVDIIKNGNFTQMPMLYGFTEMEGIYRLTFFEQWKDEMNDNFSDFLPPDLSFKNKTQKEQIADTVKKFYFNDKAVGNETMQNYIDFFGDVMFAFPTLRSLRLHVEAGNNEIYLYQYSYINDILQSTNPYNYSGATHCAQLAAVTDNGYLTGQSEEYKNMVDLMRNLWLNFYKTGRPLAEPTSEFPQGWPAASTNGSPYMNLDNPSTLKGVLLEKRMNFWDKIYNEYYRKPIPPRPSLSSSSMLSCLATYNNIIVYLLLFYFVNAYAKHI